tara:strand:- start:145 stop:1203 length:1059 start_codon:yes stop_codon:yes gene_type:complete
MSFLINYKNFEKDIYVPKNSKDFNEKYNIKKIKVNILANKLKFLSLVGSVNLINKGVGFVSKINKPLLYNLGYCDNKVFKKIFPGINCSYDDIRKPKFVDYVWNKNNFNGITLFCDNQISDVTKFKSKYKIAIVNESKNINKFCHKAIHDYHQYFDLIFTHNKDILKKYPDKTIFTPGSAVILEWEQIKIFKKNKLISFPTSSKFRGLEGYKIREKIKNCILNKKFNKKIDTFGAGFGKPFISKIICLKDYMFCICLENSKYDYYVTEKLFDVILTGCVPIYWGMPSINEIFDERGIITFNNLEELKEIINNLTEEKYNNMLPYVERNFNIAKKFIDWDDNVVKSVCDKLKI